MAQDGLSSGLPVVSKIFRDTTTPIRTVGVWNPLQIRVQQTLTLRDLQLQPLQHRPQPLLLRPVQFRHGKVTTGVMMPTT